MATIDIHNLSGEKVGTLDLADEIFGAVNEDLLWEAVKHYRAAQRAGTHKTKSRWEVSGSGKKLWKQKGTGRARIGSIRSPLWRHGYTVHGPQPRSYDYTFPRKKLLGALRSALAAKLADGKLIVVNAFDVKEPKTKDFRKSLDSLKVDKTVLIVEEAKHENKQSGIERAQHCRARTDSQQRSASLSPAAIRPRDFLAAGDREAAGFAEELRCRSASTSRKPKTKKPRRRRTSERRGAHRHEKAAEVA